MTIAIILTAYFVSNIWTMIVYSLMFGNPNIGEASLLAFAGLPMFLWYLADEL